MSLIDPHHEFSKTALRHLLVSLKDGTHGSFQRTTKKGIPLLSAKNVINGQLLIEDSESLISEEDFQSIHKSGYLKSGDVLLTIVGTIGRTAIFETDKPVAFQRSVAVLRPGLTLYNKFLYYGIQSSEFQAALLVRTKQSAQSGVYLGDVGDTPLSYPQIPLQKLIACFLDRKTAAIDTLIAKKQRLIQLLEEKRTALINQAVTKGLNPNAPMKDSGIAWIGEIPEHWEVKTIGNISQVVRGASPRPAGDLRYFDGDAYPWITVGEITKDSKMHLTSTENFLTKLGCEQSRLIPKGTLLLTNSGATLGVPKITLIDGCINDGSVALFKIVDKVEKEFLYFVFTTITKLLRDRLYQGSGQPNLNTDLVKAIRFSCPPLKEQVKIVASLKMRLDKDSKILERQFESIEKLQEYRRSLITAAVTGKLDINSLN